MCVDSGWEKKSEFLALKLIKTLDAPKKTIAIKLTKITALFEDLGLYRL